MGSYRRNHVSRGQVSGQGLPGSGIYDRGCINLRSSHLRLLSLCALKKWRKWSLDIKNARLQANSFDHDVIDHAPAEWDPSRTARTWKLRAPARGLNDAPAAFYNTLHKYLLGDEHSIEEIGFPFAFPDTIRASFLLCEIRASRRAPQGAAATIFPDAANTELRRR